MTKPAFVKFEVPKDIINTIYEAVTMATQTGKVRKGVNETTKCIERGLAKLVVMAEDVDPPEILMHIPILCEEKQIPYIYVPSKVELGRSAGIPVGTSSVAIEKEGEDKKILENVIARFKQIKK